MKLQQYSVRKFLLTIMIGAGLTAVIMLLTLYLLTRNSALILCGLLLSAAFFAWGAVQNAHRQRRLCEMQNSSNYITRKVKYRIIATSK